MKNLINKICVYFLTFQLYSVAGWVTETLLYVFRDRKFVKRGFLFGPLCPIYGTGAVLCTLLFYGKINNIFLLFVVGSLVCGALEYITHFLMEKLFHAMWWDYSSRRFNIKGRVYLKGVLMFGAGVVLIVKVLQPFVFRIISLIPVNVLYGICFALYSVMLVDLTFTLTDLTGLIQKLKKLQSVTLENVQREIDKGDEQLNTLANSIKENSHIQAMAQEIKNNPLLIRIKYKYPNFTLTKYKKIWEIIDDKPDPSKARKDIKLYGSSDSGDEKSK